MIRKHNLDPSLINWIMTITGLGPGIGDVFFVADEDSNYYYWLRDDLKVDPAHLFTNLLTAYNTTTGSRNDCILAAPGAYLATAELAWSKSNTHLIGLGGPNTMGDFYEPNVVFYTSGTAVASTITITGANCQFINVGIQNYGNNAACLTAVTLNNYGCTFKNVTFMGNMTTNQNTTAAAASLYIGTSGHYPIFESCQIGQDVWGARSGANSGQLRFTGSQPNGGQFRNCIFRSISSTASCAMIAVATGTGIGRGWLFNNCHFANFSATATEMNHVFYAPSASGWWPVAMMNCMASGYSRWTDLTDYRIFGNMPIADDGGGLEISLDHTVAGGS